VHGLDLRNRLMAVAVDILLSVPLFSMYPLSVLLIQAVSNSGSEIVSINTQSAVVH